MNPDTPGRTIAIVGRPNVGKSALFNRLARRRMSIVHEESGVTRDRVVTEAYWANQRFELVDTGGLGLMDRQKAPDLFEAGIREQVHIAIGDAAVLVFVVDLEAGVVPLDEEVARLLHASGHPVFLAANKADHPEKDRIADEFSSLGFPVFPVSALHNRGLAPLMDAALGELPPPVEEPEEEALKVAVVGKPNAGKSSYINRLLRSKRVMVSDVPGTTRDSVEIPFAIGKPPHVRHYQLIDTAGIRRRRQIRDAVELFSVMRTEKSVERADVVVHVVDGAAGFGTNDKKIAAMIREHRRGHILMINKWDLVEVTQRHFSRELSRQAPFLAYVPVVYASAETGFNIRRSIEAIDYVATQVRSKLTTGVLNRVLHDAFRKTPPPVAGRKRVRFYYATQVGEQPVRIKLFVSNGKYLSSSYRSYLEKNLRRAFGLEGAPIVLQFSARRPPPA